MKKQPFTYRDAKRIGGTTLRLTMPRWAWDYAKHQASGEVFGTICKALQTVQDELTVD
jgi:hypothetical protein